MNKLPLGGLLKDACAALSCIGMMRKHHVVVKIQPAPISQTEAKQHAYSDAQKLLKPTAPPAGQSGEWYMLEDDVVWCEVVSVPYLSYDIQLAPGLSPDSGYMEILISRKHGKIQLLKSFLKAESGAHIHDEWFERYRISKVEISPSLDSAFCMSGETIAEWQPAQPVLAACHVGNGKFWY